MRLDLHTHSRYSPDSSIDVKDIVRKALDLHLGGIAITDHNAIDGAQKAKEYAQALRGFVVLRGIEVSSSEGHILGYGIAEMIPRNLPPQETVEHIVAQGGVAVAAHPYRFWSGLGEKITVGTEFTTYEVRNARTSSRGNEKASVLASKNGKGLSGGSDGHFVDEIGGAVTVFEERLEREDDVLQALAKKQTTVEGRSRGARGTMRYVPKSVAEWMIRGFRRI